MTERDSEVTPQPGAEVTVLYTVEEAAKMLHHGKTWTWGVVRSGELRSFKIGARRVVSEEAIEEFIRRSEAAPIASRSRTGPAGCGWCPHPAESHWEVAEPGGPRTGCAVLGCPCGNSAEEQRQVLVPLPEDRPLLNLLEAAALLRIGRATAYELARRGEFPVEVLRIGAHYKIRTADLRRYLGLGVNGDAP